MLTTLKQHANLVKAINDPNTYLTNESSDPLRRSLHSMDLDDLLLMGMGAEECRFDHNLLSGTISKLKQFAFGTLFHPGETQTTMNPPSQSNATESQTGSPSVDFLSIPSVSIRGMFPTKVLFLMKSKRRKAHSLKWDPLSCWTFWYLVLQTDSINSNDKRIGGNRFHCPNFVLSKTLMVVFLKLNVSENVFFMAGYPQKLVQKSFSLISYVLSFSGMESAFWNAKRHLDAKSVQKL